MLDQRSQGDAQARMFIFDSQTEITEYVDKNKFEASSKQFTGMDVETWEDVEEKAQAMWEEGMIVTHQYINRLRAEEIPELKCHKRTFTWDVEGDELDMERMAQGDPKCWKKFSREESTGPTQLTIITDTTTPAFVSPEQILWRGAAALALTQILEEKGYQVELWLTNGSYLFDLQNYPVCTSVRLKKGSDPLDMGTLVNTVAGWFYRTATFALLRTLCSKYGHQPAYGLGACYTPTAVDLDLLSKDELRIYSSGVFTFEGAHYMILDQLSKLPTKGPKEQ